MKFKRNTVFPVLTIILLGSGAAQADGNGVLGEDHNTVGGCKSYVSNQCVNDSANNQEYLDCLGIGENMCDEMYETQSLQQPLQPLFKLQSPLRRNG